MLFVREAIREAAKGLAAPSREMPPARAFAFLRTIWVDARRRELVRPCFSANGSLQKLDAVLIVRSVMFDHLLNQANSFGEPAVDGNSAAFVGNKVERLPARGSERIAVPALHAPHVFARGRGRRNLPPCLAGS